MRDYEEKGRIDRRAWERSLRFAPPRSRGEPDPWTIIKYFMPPEDQGDARMQINRPHDASHVAWVAGWCAERDRLAPVVPEPPPPDPEAHRCRYTHAVGRWRLRWDL